MEKKKALITGITGQDGSYLAEMLLHNDYEVHGVIRRTSNPTNGRIGHLVNDSTIHNLRLFLHSDDLTDPAQTIALIANVQPDEIYNLGAQSHVGISFDMPEHTGDINALGAGRILEAIRGVGLQKKTRFYQASSSEMFGKAQQSPQTEATPFRPCSPYACSKVYAHWLTVNYRENYGLHASCGILYNHESPRRGDQYVTRKITRAAARIKVGLDRVLSLGNLHARRDWGFAPEYVRMMWLMLQQEKPEDYIVATNESHSVKEFCAEAFGLLDLDWRDYVVHDRFYERPAEVEQLIGDPAKAKRELGWEPQVHFKDLVKVMVEHDLALARRECERVLPSTPAPP